MLVCTRGAAFEMDWWKFVGVSVDTTILHTFLSAPVCTACTDMVYSKELERDVTTTAMAKAILRMKTLTYMPCVKCSCSELKLAKHLHTFFVLT